MMTKDEFDNGLRLLRSIDASELGNPDWWDDFRSDPYSFMVRGSDEASDLIWAAMTKRGAVKVPIWEDVAIAICCGKHCDAANHAPDHDMGADRYCQEYGCESQENYKSANAVIEFLRIKSGLAQTQAQDKQT